jgi:mandelate racemase
MKVEKIDVRVVTLPLKRVLLTSIHKFERLYNVLVEVRAEGLTGSGYSFVFSENQAKCIEAMVWDLAEVIQNRQVEDINRHWADMWMRINFIGQSGPPIMAMAALDTALWDLLAQKSQLPLYKLLGAVRDEVPLYATGGWMSYSNEELAEEGLKFKEEGFARYKIKIGFPDWRIDVERVRYLREAVGIDMDIMVDANQGLTVKNAINAGRAFEELGVTWFEEPVSVQDVVGSAQIATALNIPVATGETVFTRYGFLPIINSRAADVLMPDLMRCGGPTEFMKVASLAQTFNLPVSSHLFTEVSAHLIAACPNGTLVEYIPGWWDDLFEEAPRPSGGSIKLPDGPGIGIKFNSDRFS